MEVEDQNGQVPSRNLTGKNPPVLKRARKVIISPRQKRKHPRKYIASRNYGKERRDGLNRRDRRRCRHKQSNKGWVKIKD